MNSFFTLLDLPARFDLNLKTLEQHYFAAQRQWHPDRFVGQGADMRGEAAAKSVLINDAYDTLKNPLERAKHLLELQGFFIDDETNPPPALLMEMMELRERIHDASNDGRALLAMVEEIKALATSCHRELSAAFEANNHEAAQAETLRLGYLGKAMEEAHMLLYRVNAEQAGSAH